jgi:DNA-binding MarR family transcriptional regulator
VHQVELTDAGRAEFRSLLGAVQGFDAQLTAGLSDDELATLRALLHRLVANATTPTTPTSPTGGDDTEEAR